MISAREALECLRYGNRRFVSGVRSSDTVISQTRRSELAESQEPFAIILGCSDSRVPAEIVFDQGPGRPVCHPRCRKHCRFLTNRQRRVRRRAVRHTARRGPGPFALRRCFGHNRGTKPAKRKPVAESAFDRRPRSAIGGSIVGDGTRGRPRCSGAARRSGQRPRLRKPSPTRIGSP